MQTEDREFWRRVLWGIHGPIAALLCLVSVGGGFLCYRGLGFFDDAFTSDVAVKLALRIGLTGSLVYWAFGTISIYRQLKVARAVERRFEIGRRQQSSSPVRPNQSPQRNAGSRPSSGDSPASETPSSLGPRG